MKASIVRRALPGEALASKLRLSQHLGLRSIAVRCFGTESGVKYAGGQDAALQRLPRHAVRGNLERMLLTKYAGEMGDEGSEDMPTWDHIIGQPLDEESTAQIKRMLHDARSVNDKRLTLQLIAHYVEPLGGHVPPDILTICIQLFEHFREYDAALKIYLSQRDYDNVNVRHITSILRLLKNSVQMEGKREALSQKREKNNVKEKAAEKVDKDTEIKKVEGSLALGYLQRAMDVYHDALHGSFSEETGEPLEVIEGSRRSVILASAILGVLAALPKHSAQAHPELVEQAIGIMLNLNASYDDEDFALEQTEQTDDETETAETVRENSDGNLRLIVRPHHGLYAQLISIAGNAGLYNVASSLYENMTDTTTGAGLAPTAHTLAALLTAAERCGEYEEAHKLYESQFCHANAGESDDGEEKPVVPLAVLSKYMDVCWKSKNVPKGLRAYDEFVTENGVQSLDWLSLLTLHNLVSAEVEDIEAPPISPPKVMAQEQRKAVEFIADLVVDHIQRKSKGSGLLGTSWKERGATEQVRKGDMPLELLNGSVGTYLISKGQLDIILQALVQLAPSLESDIYTQQKYSRRLQFFWKSLFLQLYSEQRWRELLALLERVVSHGSSFSGHSTTADPMAKLVPAEIKMELLGATTGLLMQLDEAGHEGQKDRAKAVLNNYLPHVLHSMNAFQALNPFPSQRLPKSEGYYRLFGAMVQERGNVSTKEKSDCSYSVNHATTSILPDALTIVLKSIIVMDDNSNSEVTLTNSLSECLLLTTNADQVLECLKAVETFYENEKSRMTLPLSPPNQKRILKSMHSTIDSSNSGEKEQIELILSKLKFE